MDQFVPVRSQRPLSSAPQTALISSPNNNSTLAVLWKIYGAEPVKLRRTQQGRVPSHRPSPSPCNEVVTSPLWRRVPVEGRITMPSRSPE